MTITVVGTGANASIAGGSTLSANKTGVTVGNLVVCVGALSRGDTAATAISPPSGWSAAENPTAPAGGSGNYQPVDFIFYKIAAATTETCAPTVPNGSYGYARVIEVNSSLGALALAAAHTSLGNNTNATSGNTGTTSAVSGTENICIAVVHPEDQVGNITGMSNPLTSGFTTIFNDPVNNTVIAMNSGYKTGVTGTQQASATWTTNAKCIGSIAVFEVAAPSTWDRAETSAGTEAEDRSVALARDEAETSAGTTAQDRSVPLARDQSETSAGTETQDRTINVGRDAAETSAGTEAEDRTLALTRDQAESSAGTTAQDFSAVAFTVDRAETSAGTETQDRTLAVGRDTAETTAGTEAQDRDVALARDAAETSAGTTDQDYTAPATYSAAETSAGTEAQDRTVALSVDVSEISAGTEAQDRSVPLARDQAETSAGTEAQDRAVSLSRDEAETSAGTEAQDRSLVATVDVSETSAGTETQDRSLALTRDQAETSAGTTDQDYIAGAIFDVAETSAGTTDQDRSLAPVTRDVSESSIGSTTQGRATPAGDSQSALRRTLIQIYSKDLERYERERATKTQRQSPPSPQKRTVVLQGEPRMRRPDELEAATRLAQSAMSQSSLLGARLELLERRISLHNTKTNSPAVREQAEDEDLLLLAAVL